MTKKQALELAKKNFCVELDNVIKEAKFAKKEINCSSDFNDFMKAKTTSVIEIINKFKFICYTCPYCLFSERKNLMLCGQCQFGSKYGICSGFNNKNLWNKLQISIDRFIDHLDKMGRPINASSKTKKATKSKANSLLQKQGR